MLIVLTAKEALQMEHVLKCIDQRKLDLIEIPKDVLKNIYLELEKAELIENIHGKTGWIAPLRCTPEGRVAYQESRLLRNCRLLGAA